MYTFMFPFKARILFAHSFLFVLCFFGNIYTNMALNKNISEDTIRDLSRACNSFCQNIYKIVAANEEKNVVHSPLGLHSLLSLLSYGADKSTVDEMKGALHFSDAHIHSRYKELIPYLNDVEDVQLSIANAIYIQDDFPIIKEFLDIGVVNFYAEIANVNFANKVDATETINAWVKAKTNDKIQTAVQPTDIDKFTRVILLNVIHFKGSWLRPFDVNNTVLKDFHVSRSIIKKVPTMVKEARYHMGSIDALDAEFIEIPYKNKEFVMVVFKPNKIDGLVTLETNFSPDLLSKYETMEETVKLHLPKFKFEVTIDLNDILCKMNMRTMFSDDADFSKMSDAQVPLKVSKVYQKVYIDVNEEGTEAAAFSGAVMRLKRSLMIAEDFIIDRPFMFVLKHKLSNIPLFIGSVRDFEDVNQVKDEL